MSQWLNEDFTLPSTFGEQQQVIKRWWQACLNAFVKEYNNGLSDRRKHKRVSQFKDVPVETIYNFLMNQNIASDRIMAVRIVKNELDKPKEDLKQIDFDDFNKIFCKSMFKLALTNMIEQLKKAQKVKGMENTEKTKDKIRMYNKNKKISMDGSEDDDDRLSSGIGLIRKMLKMKMKEKVHDEKFYQEDADLNYIKEIPLSLQLQKFQRKQLLQGLKPVRDQA